MSSVPNVMYEHCRSQQGTSDMPGYLGVAGHRPTNLFLLISRSQATGGSSRVDRIGFNMHGLTFISEVFVNSLPSLFFVHSMFLLSNRLHDWAGLRPSSYRQLIVGLIVVNYHSLYEDASSLLGHLNQTF